MAPHRLMALALPQSQQYLRPGLTLAVLQRIASTRSDTEAAQRMQQAKRKLFDALRRPDRGNDGRKKSPKNQEREFFSSWESAKNKGALSTFPPPRLRLLHFLRIQPPNGASSTTVQALPQAHSSIGKDSYATTYGVSQKAIGEKPKDVLPLGRLLPARISRPRWYQAWRRIPLTTGWLHPCYVFPTSVPEWAALALPPTPARTERL
jgi:hypothetical protein